MAAGSGKERHVAPVKLKLLITIVPRNKGGYYMDLIQSFEVNFQIAIPAHGTADVEILQYLGLTDIDKTAIFSVLREDKLDAVLESLGEKFRSIKNGNGVAAVIPFTSMIGTQLFGFLSNDARAVKED